jgi:hypothetical protein
MTDLLSFNKRFPGRFALLTGSGMPGRFFREVAVNAGGAAGALAVLAGRGIGGIRRGDTPGDGPSAWN